VTAELSPKTRRLAGELLSQEWSDEVEGRPSQIAVDHHRQAGWSAQHPVGDGGAKLRGSCKQSSSTVDDDGDRLVDPPAHFDLAAFLAMDRASLVWPDVPKLGGTANLPPIPLDDEGLSFYTDAGRELGEADGTLPLEHSVGVSVLAGKSCVIERPAERLYYSDEGDIDHLQMFSIVAKLPRALAPCSPKLTEELNEVRLCASEGSTRLSDISFFTSRPCRSFIGRSSAQPRCCSVPVTPALCRKTPSAYICLSPR
jgi:hypothetical protein